MDKCKLGPRLKAVASFIPAGSRVADIGTDHGYLPIWLRSEGVSPTVIASDIRSGPLAIAKANAARYRIDGITFRLCPGLRDIRPQEADVVVIAGMSGETICTILECAEWDWVDKRLVLEANTKQPELLTWLYTHGLHVEGECFPEERGRIYRVLSVVSGIENIPRPAFLWGGFCDGPYAKRQSKLLFDALSGMNQAKAETELLRAQEYQNILEDMYDAYHWRDSQ